MSSVRAARAAFLLVAASSAWGQTPALLRCITNVGPLGTVRGEGFTEMVNDLVLVCTGGDPSQPVQADIQVFLNTLVTSRLLPDDPIKTEALLLIEDPDPASQRLGVNVFQGRLQSSSSLVFPAVRIVPPGPAGSRLLRITNVRVNAALLSEVESPRQVVMYVAASGAGLARVENPHRAVAVVRQGLEFSFADAPEGCRGLSRGMTLSFAEQFGSSFRPRGSISQNQPALLYGTESGLTPSPPLPGTPGRATQGTRLLARVGFFNVPIGSRLVVPRQSSFISPGFSRPSAVAQLVSGADTDGSGGDLTEGDSLDRLAITAQPIQLVWEVTRSGPAVESLSFCLEVAPPPETSGSFIYLSLGPGVRASGPAKVPQIVPIVGMLAPTSSVQGASAGDPAPRFGFDSSSDSEFSAPAITGLSPPATAAGSPGFDLTIRGSRFDLAVVSEGSTPSAPPTVRWNQQLLAPTVYRSEEVTVRIPARLIAIPGQVTIAVIRAGDSQESNEVTFAITPSPAPVITSISPSVRTAGAPSFSLDVNGLGFVAGDPADAIPASVVWWDDLALATTVMSGTLLRAVVPANLLRAGVASVTVRNPGDSNSASFLGNPPPRIITTSLPDARPGNAYSQTLASADGTPPLAWSVNPNTPLPTGLALNSTTGVISGTPSRTEVVEFQVELRDSFAVLATTVLRIRIEALPTITLNLPATWDPDQQHQIDLRLSAPFSTTVAGAVTLAFARHSAVRGAPSGDAGWNSLPAGACPPCTVNFTIPAGATEPVIPMVLRTGTLAGNLILTVTAGPIAPPPAATVPLVPSPPVVQSAEMARVSESSLAVRVTGYSTTREVTQARFAFAASAALQLTGQPIDVTADFDRWFSNTTGGTFCYVQPFLLDGDLSEVQSVTLTLASSTAASAPAMVTRNRFDPTVIVPAAQFSCPPAR